MSFSSEAPRFGMSFSSHTPTLYKFESPGPRVIIFLHVSPFSFTHTFAFHTHFCFLHITFAFCTSLLLFTSLSLLPLLLFTQSPIFYYSTSFFYIFPILGGGLVLLGRHQGGGGGLYDTPVLKSVDKIVSANRR